MPETSTGPVAASAAEPGERLNWSRLLLSWVASGCAAGSAKEWIAVTGGPPSPELARLAADGFSAAEYRQARRFAPAHATAWTRAFAGDSGDSEVDLRTSAAGVVAEAERLARHASAAV